MSAPVMTELACRIVHRLSGGNARLINQVCDVSLAYGFAEQARLVTARMVMKAAADRAASGILPLTPSSVEDLLTPEAERKENEEASSAASTADKTPKVQKPEARDRGTPTSYERGLAYKEAGQYRQAIACFDQAREDPAIAVKADVQTALCYKAAGRLDDAATVLRQLLKDKKGTEGERRQIRYLLARIYERLGRTEQAVAHYRILQQDDPAFRDTAVRLGQLSSSRGWSSVIVSPFTGPWLRSMTKSWAHLLRISL
jgi:tetratricopeptide (TPR) repeat protein